MSNNILIIPGSASIQFSGSVANTIRLQVEPSGSIAFYGNSGSLFGISDSLSGSLMSVNDISGLPILEVFSDDRVVMGTFNRNTLVVTGSRVGIDKAVPTADLDISGSVFVTGSLLVQGIVSASSFTGSLSGLSTSASFTETSSFARNTNYRTGKIISVDVNSSNATNIRTNLSKYDPTRPFTTIQAAVNAASTNDHIWIYPGTYNESIEIGRSGSLSLNFLLYSGVVIDGGTSFAIYSGTGSSAAINIDMMPNTTIRNTGVLANPSGSAVMQIGNNSGCAITGLSNPRARTYDLLSSYDYTVNTATISSVNAHCIYSFGPADFNPEKVSGVTIFSQNSSPIAVTFVAGMVYENCVIYSVNDYGVTGISVVDSFINCLIVSHKSCIYSQNSVFGYLSNCDLYSTTEYGLFGTNNIGGRVTVNNCRINSFSQSLYLGANGSAPMRYEISNNVFGSRNLASSEIILISDAHASSTGVFSNNVVNKSTVTLPVTIAEFNTYITDDVSGSIPFIITT